MSNPRVAYVLKMFPRFSETFVLAELLELERQGIDVRVYSLRPPVDRETHADLARLRAPVEYVPRATWSSAKALLLGQLETARRHPLRYLAELARVLAGARWSLIKHFAQACWLAPRVEAEGIRHIHAHFASSPTTVALHLKRLTGIRYSFTAHAKDIYLRGVRRRTLAHKLSEASAAVTVSDYNRRHLAAIHRASRLVRIYNGLDLEQFAPRPARRVDPPLILGVGRLVEKKGFDDLLRALAILDGRRVAFRCRIVGIGPERATLIRLCDELELGARVAFAGPMPRERLIEYLPTASVLAAPCVIAADGNRDGLPTVLVEALALGVPVISTDLTGIPELVQDGVTGLLVPPRDPQALADALERILRDEELGRRLAAAGRRLVVQRFDLRRNVAALRELLTTDGVEPAAGAAPQRREVAA